LFSKPSPLSFEKGKLLGSAQTRNSLRGEASWASAARAIPAAAMPMQIR
jgi:hypothetical protein